ncbi:MAG: nucleotidyl transferase AbiEii/AbiGii toxin family protein [Sedimentisphaerales bacterium]
MEIYRDFKELLELLNAHKVEYVVVGGYALAFHGAPRVTGDIDLLVKPDTTNAKRILEALAEFGFVSLNLSEADFTTPENVVQFGVPPVRVDIMNSLTGVSWEKANADKVRGGFDKTIVHFISKEDLITNKKSLGRQKDLADIEALDKK